MASDDQNRYRLTLLKKLSQSASPAKIKEAIADFETLADLHGQLSGTLSALDLGAAGIRYFAGSVQRSRLFQLRQRADNDRRIHAATFVAHQLYRTHDNLLLACVLVDRLSDGLSLVYSFFDPQYDKRSLGNYMILDHIERCRQENLPYLYLGYWVENSPKMDYKSKYHPCEVLGRHGWSRLKEPS